jgi:DNA-binding MarR family transcriptional regulator
MTRLTEALHLDPSTVTRSGDRLTSYGLITRVPVAHKGRGVQVRATAFGRADVDRTTEIRR